MSDDVSRDEFEALQDRVRELERELNTNPRNVEGGLDHRDRSVIQAIRANGDPGPRGTVILYQTKTDISSRETAKRRAKNLRNRDDYEDLIHE